MSAKQTCKAPSPKFDPCHDNYFHTSTGIGLRIIPSSLLSNRVWDYKVPDYLKTQDVSLKDDIKYTVARQSYIWPYNENDPTDKSVKVDVNSVHYISRFGERMKLDPPKPYQVFKTEYQQKYPYNAVQPITSNCVSMKSKVSCQIKSPNKDSRPSVAPGNFSRNFDPYTTTSQFEHHAFHNNDVNKYNHKMPKYTSQLPLRIKPVYDEAVFREKYIERILPKVVSRVPNSGIETEMKGNYRGPIDEMSHYSAREVVPSVPRVTGLSKTNIFLVPSMYLTEYNELGKEISTCSLKVH